MNSHVSHRYVEATNTNAYKDFHCHKKGKHVEKKKVTETQDILL